LRGWKKQDGGREMDPELKAALPGLPSLPFDDIAVRRDAINRYVTGRQDYDSAGVDISWRDVPAGGHSPGTRVQLFVPEGRRRTRAGLLDIHGGSFVTGTPEIDAFVNVEIARRAGVVVASVDYRLAPEHPFPAGAEDCYRALEWLHESAGLLGIDRSRIGVLGDSAGGGLAATVTILARERAGPPLAFQALTQPVLDDRLETPSMRSGRDTVMWNRASAEATWRLYLAGQAATPIAAPARMDDLSGLPPAYISVNELDPLRDEGVDYARRLLACGVPVELHLWAGAFHGFRIVREAAIARRAMDELIAVLARGLQETGGESQ
jgi:acetyl esterase/lipase